MSVLCDSLKCERVKSFLPLAIFYNVMKSTHDACAFVNLQGLGHLGQLLQSTQDHDMIWVAAACFSMAIELHGDFVKSKLTHLPKLQDMLLAVCTNF